MTPEEAQLALEAARKAGHVGRLAWDKLCLYYQTEAIVALILVVLGHAALTAAIVYVLRQPFAVDIKTEEKDYAGSTSSKHERGPTKWFFIAVALGIAWACSFAYAVVPLPKVVATITVPEMRAAMAVAAFTRGQAVP